MTRIHVGRDSLVHTTLPVVQNEANITRSSGRMPFYPIVKSLGHASYRRPFVRTTDREASTAPSVSKAAAAPTAHFSLVSLVSRITYQTFFPNPHEMFSGLRFPAFSNVGSSLSVVMEALDRGVGP